MEINMKIYKLVYTALMFLTTPLVLVLSYLIKGVSTFMKWMARPILEYHVAKASSIIGSTMNDTFEQVQDAVGYFEITRAEENNIITYVIDISKGGKVKSEDILISLKGMLVDEEDPAK